MTALSDRIAAEHQATIGFNEGLRCSCDDHETVRSVPDFTSHLADVTERAVRDTIAAELEKVADRHSDEAARHRADSVAAVTLRGTRSHMATAQAHRNKAEATYDAARTAREGTTP